MGHLLEKRIVVAFIYLWITMSSARKEDLERAAELAVERAAEKAAERAVEKSLEAGNQTSMTITVKESYSNARKTAEEQAAPGSESTRYNNEKTSIFESKDFPDEYETPLNEQDYLDDNDTRSETDYEDSQVYDYNDQKGYNDSRGVDDYENDYDESNDTKNNNNYSSPIEEQDTKSVNDYEEGRLEDIDDDYTIPNHTDYQKLNSSKNTNAEITENFGDFDSDFRNEFGSKLTNSGGKLEDELKFYTSGGDFSKKKDSKKIIKVEEEEEEEEEPEYKDEDTWKSYSDWHKDFKTISEESFPNGSFWDDDDDSLKLWSDDDETADKQSTSIRKVSPPTTNDKSPKDFDFKTWQSDDDDDDDEEDLDDNVPEAVIENDTKNINSYRRRSSRDDYFYRDGPVYSRPSEKATTEKITTPKSSAAKFRNTFKERSRAQYQKLMQERYSNNIRRSPNKYQNFTQRGNVTNGDRFRSYRTYTDFNDSKNSGINNPFRDLTTYRVYPMTLDDKMVTKNPVLSINRSMPISPSINPPIGLNQNEANMPLNVQRIIQEDLRANLQSNLQGNLELNLQTNSQGSLPRIPRRPSLVQLPPKMSKLEDQEDDMPPIPSKILTVPKLRRFNEGIKMKPHHPYDVIATQRSQRIPMRKQQKFITDAQQIPLFVNTALPGPFHITKQQTIVHDNRPFTIHLDKSIPIALRKRRPFIVHLPLQPYEQLIRPESKLDKIIENDSAVSENRLRKIKWS